MRKNKGFTLIELMIVIAIIAIIAAIAIPGLLQSQRASNERNASTSLKTLASAEADFRANDRDGNGVGDFWTGDVKGLYCVANTAGGAANISTNPGNKLIEISVASADADAALYGGTYCLALSTYAIPSPKAGFWYQALTLDAGAPALEQTLRLDIPSRVTGMGTCHNTSKFGFSAWPDSQSAGKYYFVVNENNTIFRSAVTSSVRPSTSNPPGTIATGTVGADFPNDTTIKALWSKLD
jgi:prepilin-type N-terminal cleavage/methylation domain-containing protein